MNTQLRLITRRAYGLLTAEALIALAMLSLGGLCPPLPTGPPETAEGPEIGPSVQQRDRRP